MTGARRPSRPWWIEWPLSLAIALAVLLPVRSSLADWCDVPTGSMEPTILVGDRIFVNRLAYGLRVPFTHRYLARWATPTPGEIVILSSPADGTRLVKRVVAEAGQTVELRDNVLLINGAPATYSPPAKDVPGRIAPARRSRHGFATESLGTAAHAIMLTPAVRAARSFGPVRVPSGHVLVLGDSRDLSADSRSFGVVPIERVVGRSSRVAFSLDRDRYWWPRWGRMGAELE